MGNPNSEIEQFLGFSKLCSEYSSRGSENERELDKITEPETNSIKVDIGICAYNEERNIERLLKALLRQKTKIADIQRIIVVSSSTDSTNDIVKRFRDIDDRIELILESKRQGKAVAVNLFLEKASSKILVLESADTIPQNNTIEKLVKPFLDPRVGMTGGRPVPTNDRNEFMGFTSHLLWQVHHNISKAHLENPKLGELVAFRNIVKNIPKDTAVDEAWIEAELRKKGFSCCYVPDAIVYNHGPENLSDFLKQRRRIYSGHLQLKTKMEYETPTMKVTSLIRVLPRSLNPSLREILYTIGAGFLEFYGRLLGAFDFNISKKNPYIWDMAESTKEV